MHRKVLRSPVIDAHRIASQAADFPLDEQRRRLGGKTGKVHFSLRVLIPVFLRVRPARSPARPQQNNGSSRNPSVLPLPIWDTPRAKLIIRVLYAIGPNVKNRCRPKKL